MKNLKEYLGNPIFKTIAELADQHGVDTYVIGGFVRDILLNVENFDIDIVVEKDGIGLAKKVRKLLEADIVEHSRFGTATLSFPQPSKFWSGRQENSNYVTPELGLF